jgi:hypothetical protein
VILPLVGVWAGSVEERAEDVGVTGFGVEGAGDFEAAVLAVGAPERASFVLDEVGEGVPALGGEVGGVLLETHALGCAVVTVAGSEQMCDAVFAAAHRSFLLCWPIVCRLAEIGITDHLAEGVEAGRT